MNGGASLSEAPHRSASRARDTLWRMKPDIYTNAVLTVIALLLAVIVLKPFFGPTLVQAQQQNRIVAVQLGQYNSDERPLGVCSNGPNGCYLLQWQSNLKK
jgi:hypothetical protein